MTGFDDEPQGDIPSGEAEAWLRRRLHEVVADEAPSELLLHRVRREVEQPRRGRHFPAIAALAAAAAVVLVVAIGLTSGSPDEGEVALSEVTAPPVTPDPTYRGGSLPGVGPNDAEPFRAMVTAAAVTARDPAGRPAELRITLEVAGGPHAERSVFWMFLPEGDREAVANAPFSASGDIAVDLPAAGLVQGGWSRWEVSTGAGPTVVVADLSVPDLVGQPEADAVAVALAMGLKPTVGPLTGCGRRSGEVCAQDLQAGTVVANSAAIFMQLQQ